MARRVVLFSEHVRGIILRAIGQGLFRGNAAEIAGISSDALARWIARGRTAFEAWLAFDDPDAPLDDYGTFYRDVMLAEAGIESKMVGAIVAVATDPSAKGADRIKAADWWLRRKRNKRYRPVEVEVEEQTGADPIETLAARIAARVERAGQDSDPPSPYA